MQIKTTHKGKEVVLDATPEQEAILKASEEQDIISKINSWTWEDVIQIAKPDIDEQRLLNYNGINPRMIATKHELELKILCDVVNEGWVWQPGQKGWLPWFDLSSSGFRFGNSYCDHSRSFTAVGSRRCFKEEKISDACARKFPEVFKGIILIK